MKLTVEHHAESLRRYRHVKPGRRGSPLCRQLCPGTRYTCSQPRGHRGPHVAHGLLRKVVAVWDLGRASATPRRTDSSGSSRERPIGLRSKRPDGLLEASRNVLQHVAGSFEEFVWLAFFVAFVAFAIGGFLLIYLG